MSFVHFHFSYRQKMHKVLQKKGQTVHRSGTFDKNRQTGNRHIEKTNNKQTKFANEYLFNIERRTDTLTHTYSLFLSLHLIHSLLSIDVWKARLIIIILRHRVSLSLTLTHTNSPSHTLYPLLLLVCVNGVD